MRQVVKQHRQVRELVGGVRGENGVRARMENGRLVLGHNIVAPSLRRAAFSYKGINRSTGKMIFRRGLVLGHTSVQWVEETEVSIGGTEASPHLVIAEGTIAPLSGVVAGTSIVASTFSGHTATRWRVPLALVWLRNGKPFYALELKTGVIDLKTWFGP